MLFPLVDKLNVLVALPWAVTVTDPGLQELLGPFAVQLNPTVPANDPSEVTVMVALALALLCPVGLGPMAVVRATVKSPTMKELLTAVA